MTAKNNNRFNTFEHFFYSNEIGIGISSQHYYKRSQFTVNVLEQYVQYVLNNPHIVVHSVSPGAHHTTLTTVQLHKGR